MWHMSEPVGLESRGASDLIWNAPANSHMPFTEDTKAVL